MNPVLQKLLCWLRGRDRGSSAVTFILALPILLSIIGVLVQYALLANARLTVDRAVAAAARSAMTSLPTDPVIEPIDGTACVYKATRIALEPLSPAAPSTTPESESVADALTAMGIQLPSGFSQRYAYAQGATSVQIDPIDVRGNLLTTAIDYAHTAGPRVRITVRYDFRVTVPLVSLVIGRSGTVAGVSGRFLTMVSSQDVQLSDGREVPTNTNGEP